MQFTQQKKELAILTVEKKTVLGIVGSPRKGGNTETLVDSVLAGASEYGAVPEKIILHDMNISPCRACNSCQKTGKCIQQDDMDILVDLMHKCDVWVLGTPIYWWGPSAQFKAFVDRWYGLDQRLFQEKQIVLTVPMGGENSNLARHTVGMMKEICSYLGMKLVETVIAAGMNGKNSVKENRRILEDCRTAGLRVMRNILSRHRQ
ncbi:MAG: flavodoxin family protein [Candidatus Odinarchaeota archaeon]